MTPQALLAWGFIAVSLSVFADIPQTAEVAVAFAYLILLAVLFHSGARIFDGITAFLGGSATAAPLPNITPVTNHPGRGGQP
jgi:hypothetical protein